MKKIAIIPSPKKFEQESFICLGKLSSVKWYITAPKTQSELIGEAAMLITKAFSENFASGKQSICESCFEVRLVISNFAECKTGEDYKIEIDDKKAILTASTDSGLFYAAITFGKLMETDGQNAFIAKCKIYDGPAFKHRGLLQETRFDTEFLTLDDWHDIIDLYSDLKFNELTIATYGCWDIQYDMKLSQYAYLPLKNTDRLKTTHNIKYYSVKDGKWIFKEDSEPEMYKQDYLTDIIKYAKRKNINVKPLFNSLGHNTLLPQEYPEISAIDELGKPKKFGLCLSSPNTYKRMFAIYDEIIDKYLKPCGIDSMHIGLDEYRPEYNVNKNDITARVSHECHCEKCRSVGYSELIFNYTLELVKHLKSRGINSVHIYHDMFFGKDYSDKTFINKVKDMGLQENVVIEWWDYEPDDEKYFRRNRANVNSDLRSIIKPMCGYFGWAIPSTSTRRFSNLRGAARLASEIKCEGLDAYAAFEDSFDYDYTFFSQMAWCEYGTVSDGDILKSYVDKYFNSNETTYKTFESVFKMTAYTKYIIQIFEYYFHSYIRPDFDIPRNFPGDVFKVIDSDKDRYIYYLEHMRSVALNGFSHFDSLPHNKKTNIWRLFLKHYYVMSNEYLSLYNIEQQFCHGYISAQDVSNKIGELIKEREAFILLAENVRRNSTRLTYLRNASIFRQYLIDFKSYVDLSIEKNEELKIDLKNPPFKGSDIFYSLR